MIVCSTGGIGGKERPRRMVIEQGFQVPFAAQIRRSSGLSTMAVGFLWYPRKCEEVIQKSEADMVALARALLVDPNWPLRAAKELGASADHYLVAEGIRLVAEQARALAEQARPSLNRPRG